MMNRQRRLEAIARRRAIIDNHLHMLSSANEYEMRLPNIIRSRTGRMRERPQVSVDNQQLLQQQPMAQKHLGAGAVNSVGALGDVLVGSGESNGQSQNLVQVPVDISEKIASIIAANNGDITKSFQTIQTEDGTVMVVLDDEGISFNWEEGAQGNVSESAVKKEETTDEAEAMEVQSQSGYDQVEQVDQQEGCYVIVQSENGNEILVPSSMYSQTPTQVPEKKPAPPAKKVPNPSRPGPNTSRCIKTKQNPGSNLRTTQKVGFKNNVKPKIPGKTGPRLKISQGNAVQSRVKVETAPQEKPRPFRFELPPELEQQDPFSDLQDNFLSVPIPLRIDSIRSETESENYKPKPIKTNESALPCSKCSETFTRPLDLLQHVKLVHTNASLVEEKVQQIKTEIDDFSPITRVSNTTTSLEVDCPAANVKIEPEETPVIASQCVQTTTSTSATQEDTSIQNAFTVSAGALEAGTYTITTDEEGTVFLQLVDESLQFNVPDHNLISNSGTFPSQDPLFEGNFVPPAVDGYDEGVALVHSDKAMLAGRRTVSKAMVKSEKESSNNVWLVQDVHSLSPPVSLSQNYVIDYDYDGNSISVHSA